MKKLDELSLAHMRAVVRDTGVEMVAMQASRCRASCYGGTGKRGLAETWLGSRQYH